MAIKSATMQGDLVRLHVSPPDNKPMHVYLERAGHRLRVAELRDEHDKMSIKAMMAELPPHLQASMKKFIDGVMDMMDRLFDLEQCES
jgi:hypothetical protein